MGGNLPIVQDISKGQATAEQVMNYAYEQQPEIGRFLDDMLAGGWMDAINNSARKLRENRERKYCEMQKSGTLTTGMSYLEMARQRFLLQVFKSTYDEYGTKEGTWEQLMISHITPHEFLRELYQLEAEADMEMLVSVPEGADGWQTKYLFKSFYKDCKEIRSKIKQIEATPKIKQLLKESCKRRRYTNRKANKAKGKYITQIAYRFRIYTWMLNAAYTEVCIKGGFRVDPREAMLDYLTAERFERAIIAIETKADIEDTWIMTRADRGYC